MRILMRYPHGRKKALTLSYDDGVAQDIRLVEIMSKHGLKGTFNINAGLISETDAIDGKGRMSRRQIIDLYAKSGNEVAIHAYSHPHLEELDPVHITHEILRDRLELEQIFRTIIRGMAYPFGTYNDRVVDCLSTCGIVYSRTTQSTEWFDLPKDWLRLPATCHHNNPRLFELADKFLTLPRRDHYDVPWLFYLWGHSYEFDDHNNWALIKEFAEKMGGHKDIWYATNIEIYDYVHAFRQLQYNAAGTLVYNPTMTDLWMQYYDQLIEIKAGQTIYF